jgi:putative ABC transport system permease protein
MTLRNIALKNIKGNLEKFVMYYFSNALVVMVFFIFANFLMNPQVKNIKVMGQMGAITTEAMYLCEIVILVFSLVFTNYSISSFLKSREKEFGLLTMFGLTRSQIRSYIMFENLAVAILSIVTGLFCGIIFSKLFFMAVSAILILDAELTLTVSFKAIILTAVCFLILFQGICFISSHKIKNNNIIELLKGAKIAKPVPKFSVKKAIAAIMLIAFGYIMALLSGQAIIITMLPILVVTVAGTYMFYSQFSVYFTNKLQSNKKVFYKGTNMITLSQIIYKLKDNSRILFAVSILSAVTLTASASVYSFQKVVQKNIVVNFPQDISFIEDGIDSHQIISTESIDRILKSYGNEIQGKTKAILLKGTNEGIDKAERQKGLNNKKDFYIISNSDYNSLANSEKISKLNLKAGEAVIHSYNFTGGDGKKIFSDIKELNLNIEGQSVTYRLSDEISGGIINAEQNYANTVVISDYDFIKLKDKVKNDKLKIYYGYNLKDSMKAEKAVTEIKSQIPKEMKSRFNERVTDFTEVMKSMSLFFFIGTFISILFFIATGSILYFKLFNEVQKDKQEYIALKKMGMSFREIKKVINIQCAIMFFLPFAVAFLHTCFAIKALSNILRSNLSVYLMLIVCIYLLFQTIYYLFAKAMYIRQISRWN